MIWWNHFAWNFGIEDGDGIRLNSRMVDILFIVLYLVVSLGIQVNELLNASASSY